MHVQTRIIQNPNLSFVDGGSGETYLGLSLLVGGPLVIGGLQKYHKCNTPRKQLLKDSWKKFDIYLYVHMLGENLTYIFMYTCICDISAQNQCYVASFTCGM